MGPLRNRATRQSYDPEMLENWTIVRLQEELTKRNISFPRNARRMALVRLLRPAIEARHEGNPAINASDRHDLLGSARSHDSMEATQQDGRAQGREETFLQLLSSMTTTMQSMQKNVSDLTGKVNELMAKQSEKDKNDSRTENRTVQQNSTGPTGNACYNECSSTSTNAYDLGSAYSALRKSTRSASLPSAAAGSEMQARAMNQCSQWGYSAESLPFVETISSTLKKNIIAGKDVNLAALLIPYYNGSGVNSTECCDESKSKQDIRLNRDLNIKEFILAFGTYKNVMCSAYPERRPELDAYERHIVDMSSRYQGNGFYEYHKRFSAEAAAHLRYNNTAVDWSIKNNTLFCNIFSNLRPMACSLCSSTFHTANFCNRSSGSQKFNAFKFKRNDDVDTYGRERVFHKDREICNNFNGARGCSSFRCRNFHVCVICKGDHSKMTCPQLSKNEMTGAQKIGAPMMRKI